MPDPSIPLSFQELDLRLLPYYLTGERVEVTWSDDERHDWIRKYPNKFWIDIEFAKGWRDGPDYINYIVHHIIFTSLPKKNSRYGHFLKNGTMSDILGIGIRCPHFPPKWPPEAIIKYQLMRFNLMTLRYNWLHSEGIIEILNEHRELIKEVT